MKTRFLPLLIAALLLSGATSEARSRRHFHSGPMRAPVPRDRGSEDDGGPLARSRGLSQVESAAVGAVLAEIAGSHAAAADANAAPPPARRYSPDYYRVYSHRTQMAGARQRVAVKPAAATSQPVPATPVVAAKPAAVAAKRVAIAPPASKAPKVIPAPVAAVTAPVATRKRVAVAPAPTGTRTAFAPQPMATKVPPPAPPASGVTPVRAVFRN
jgi:hypothetical protein